MKIQNYPSSDSISVEPFENLVNVYYQTQGYITSSNKWFWVWEDGKKQRGYQDIDVLAINEKETIIVSVTGNLDDKIRFGNNKSMREDQRNSLENYFKRVEEYLTQVEQYKWLIAPNRNICRVIAYVWGEQSEPLVTRLREDDGFKALNIDLISANTIIEKLYEFVESSQQKGLKTNNSLIKLVQIFRNIGYKSKT